MLQMISALDKVICLWDTNMEISHGQLNTQVSREIKLDPCLWRIFAFGGSFCEMKETEM